MSQLLQAPPERLRALGERAEQYCLAFADEPLPPGASPRTGRVGIEIDPGSGRALLYVERGIRYDGPNREVGSWFATGTLAFATYDDLRRWLAGPLAAAYDGHATSTPDSGTASPATPSRPVDALVIDNDRLAEALEAEVIGQHGSAVALARAAALHLARVAPRRPLTALALGPTGVGKTLMAETLAAAIAAAGGGPCDYLRLDMTEFQERHTVSKLFGAPPGYVGFGDDTQLVRTLRSGGRAVVLIDEIEKAHPDVFLAVMNLMDAGRLTPAFGAPIDARQSILVFTTNLAVDVIRAALAEADSSDPVARDTVIRAALRSHGIPPELVGRIHELLVFDDFDDKHLDAVIARSIEREACTFGLNVLQIAPSVIDALRARRPDPGSGARAWEHLICVDLGPAFLDARRRGVSGPASIIDYPITVEEAAAGSGIR